jgi:hypothetical protein
MAKIDLSYVRELINEARHHAEETETCWQLGDQTPDSVTIRAMIRGQEALIKAVKSLADAVANA